MFDGLITVLFRLPIREISPLTYKWMKDNSGDKWQPWWCINFAASISSTSLISNSFGNKPWVMYHQRAKVATLGLRACLVILFSFLFTSWCITSENQMTDATLTLEDHIESDCLGLGYVDTVGLSSTSLIVELFWCSRNNISMVSEALNPVSNVCLNRYRNWYHSTESHAAWSILCNGTITW